MEIPAFAGMTHKQKADFESPLFCFYEKEMPAYFDGAQHRLRQA